ncbi:MAG: hypothetical protein N3D80_11390 [Ignavibacterium album]|uniref:hypothetical protein n=1 Tax=Ignavibacterium album TaxID=591197 RepID=UPI0026EBD330|nr:hypothetical protein [Ignavibacterium album]MCX8106462.1 hypothetical protein [Ignavibacterium album]
MNHSTEKYKTDFILILLLIKKFAILRNHNEALIKCNILIYEIENLKNNLSADELDSLRNRIINLIDEMRYVIQAEMRFILFPLADIKKEAYEIGKSYMPNFLEWINSNDSYTPEKLVGILENQIYELEEVKTQLMDESY